MSQPRRFGPLIGSIDENSNNARFFVFCAETAEMLTYHQADITSIHPKDGWIEQNPREILEATLDCMNTAIENLRHLDIDPTDIIAIGLANERETVIVWDKISGKPLYNAISWLDVRNTDTVKHFICKAKRENPDFLKPICGLSISTHFSALKLRWLIDNIPEVRKAVVEKRCLFGNVDSWLIWNLTGGINNGVHVTDVTNASRTMLMNLASLGWDPVLLRFFDIPVEILPKILSSSEIYGYMVEQPLCGVAISGCLGDQQAALVGQMCFVKGQTKYTYGPAGSFLVYNTGKSKVYSDHGLRTTVAYQFGRESAPIYALEGYISVGSASLSWLKDDFNIVDELSDLPGIASTASSDQLYFVPAFRGLGPAPHCQPAARSFIFGLDQYTRTNDILKANLEAICYQTKDILEALASDCGESCVKKLFVDGRMTVNDYTMQLLADILGIPVVRPIMTETSALGAAIAAGTADGIKVWDISRVEPAQNDVFHPLTSENERNVKYFKWKMAVNKSVDWEINSHLVTNNCADSNYKKMLAMIPASMFLMTSFGLLLISEYYVK